MFSAPRFEGDSKVRMLRLHDCLIKAFKDAKYLDTSVVNANSVTLHATVVNTKYSGGGKKNFKALIGDARNTDFGRGAVRELHLSKMRIDPATGGYVCEEKIILP